MTYLGNFSWLSCSSGTHGDCSAYWDYLQAMKNTDQSHNSKHYRLKSEGMSQPISNGLIRQSLCGTGTGTDIMLKYRTHLRSHISCSVKV